MAVHDIHQLLWYRRDGIMLLALMKSASAKLLLKVAISVVTALRKNLLLTIMSSALRSASPLQVAPLIFRYRKISGATWSGEAERRAELMMVSSRFFLRAVTTEIATLRSSLAEALFMSASSIMPSRRYQRSW